MTTPALPNPTGAEPCRRSPDPELWFATVNNKQAANLCHGCKLLDACAAYALAVDVQGTWGGTTHNQRKTIRKRLGIVPIPMISNTNAAYRTVDHGTEAGAAAHRRRYEPVCPPCLKAERLARAQRNEARVG